MTLLVVIEQVVVWCQIKKNRAERGHWRPQNLNAQVARNFENKNILNSSALRSSDTTKCLITENTGVIGRIGTVIVIIHNPIPIQDTSENNDKNEQETMTLQNTSTDEADETMEGMNIQGYIAASEMR